MITQAVLNSLLSYDLETGVFVWLESPNRRISVGSIAGTLHKHGYIQITINKKRYKAHRLAWLCVYGIEPPEQIDHINGIRNENRISNLRLATHSENQKNREKSSSNTSGFKGVIWNKLNKKWLAQATLSRKTHYLGQFDTKEEASAAYQEFAKKNHGDFYNNKEHSNEN